MEDSVNKAKSKIFNFFAWEEPEKTKKIPSQEELKKQFERRRLQNQKGKEQKKSRSNVKRQSRVSITSILRRKAADTAKQLSRPKPHKIKTRSRERDVTVKTSQIQNGLRNVVKRPEKAVEFYDQSKVSKWAEKTAMSFKLNKNLISDQSLTSRSSKSISKLIEVREWNGQQNQFNTNINVKRSFM